MMRSTPAALRLALWGLLSAVALAQRPIVTIQVAGNERLPAKAVIAASGLRVGQTITRAGLDAAAQRLADTGLFAAVNYSYDPKPSGGVTGYALTFHVTEDAARATLAIDIPGVDTEDLWRQLKSADGLIDRAMPDNDHATAYFKRAVEAVLRKSNHPQEVVLKNEAQLGTGKMTIICRPANLPKIAALRFEGNAALSGGALASAMAKVSIGQEYSERDFRRALEFNVRPLYEEMGRLTVAFPKVSMASAGDGMVTAIASIDEGPVWRLGTVRLVGDSLPVADMHDAARFGQGLPANWKQFVLAVEKMEQVLRHDGYIAVVSNPVRSFQEASHVVDVNVEVKKGPQFLFGELQIEGLDEATGQRLGKLWKLPGGAPMDQPYVNEYLRSVMPILRGKVRSTSSELRVRKDAHIVDVALKFR